MNVQQQLDGTQACRMASQDRYLGRTERREMKAAKMIGELSSGKCYVFPVGGKYREGTRGELVSFLLRNGWV